MRWSSLPFLLSLVTPIPGLFSMMKTCIQIHMLFFQNDSLTRMDHSTTHFSPQLLLCSAMVEGECECQIVSTWLTLESVSVRITSSWEGNVPVDILLLRVHLSRSLQSSVALISHNLWRIRQIIWSTIQRNHSCHLGWPRKTVNLPMYLNKMTLSFVV